MTPELEQEIRELIGLVLAEYIRRLAVSVAATLETRDSEDDE